MSRVLAGQPQEQTVATPKGGTMKAAEFYYERPETLDDALALLSDDAIPLAGGQSLMPMMNFRMARPEKLIDLNHVAGLSGISDEGATLRIGSMTRYAELMSSELIRTHVPLFGLALPHIAHAAIRNRGTIGGSLALADPAAEMPALLLALDGTICVQSRSGSREIPADKFFQGAYDTALDPEELITSVVVPKDRMRVGFHELARRHGDYAMVGVAISLQPQTRVAFFSISDRAERVRDVEAALPDIDVAVSALDRVTFLGDQNADPKTKRYLAGVVLRRAVEGMT